MAKRKRKRSRRLEPNRAKARRAYETLGYSDVSLGMLESEEGQLNAVFACYGSAAQHGQLFEESITRLIVVLNELSGIECNAEMMEKWTIGRLLGHWQKTFVQKIDEWVPQFLDEGRRLRNFLMHDYFLSRRDQLATEDGRMAMLKELSGIELHLSRAAGLINGVRVAVSRQPDGRMMPGGSDGADVVFSAELHIEKPER